MKKKKENVIKIDLDLYCTQKECAELEGISPSVLHKRITRARLGKKGDKVEYLDIPQLGITLVKRPKIN